VSDLGLSTLPRYRTDGEVRQARAARRVGVTLFAVGIALGLTGWLGVRTTTAGTTRGDVRLAVQHAAVTRAGIATPFRVDLTSPQGFGTKPLEVSVSRRLFERMDFNNFYPNPDSESVEGSHVVFEFQPPAGTTFSLTFDGRAAPNQVGSTETYDVSVGEGSRALGATRFRMTVMP
jgi:hypothetical protein